MKFIVEIEDYEEGTVGATASLPNRIEEQIEFLLNNDGSDGTVIVTKEN